MNSSFLIVHNAKVCNYRINSDDVIYVFALLPVEVFFCLNLGFTNKDQLKGLCLHSSTCGTFYFSSFSYGLDVIYLMEHGQNKVKSSRGSMSIHSSHLSHAFSFA